MRRLFDAYSVAGAEHCRRLRPDVHCDICLTGELQDREHAASRGLRGLRGLYNPGSIIRNLVVDDDRDRVLHGTDGQTLQQGRNRAPRSTLPL